MRYQLFFRLQGVTIQCHLKGKRVTRFKLLEKGTEAREIVTEMSAEILLNSSILESVEKYLCLLYGKNKYDSKMMSDCNCKCFWKNVSSSAKKVAKMK